MRMPLLSCLLTLAALLPAFAADKVVKPTPINVNTHGEEDEPQVADGGRTLYFGTTVKGKEIVKVARRRPAGGPWGRPGPIDDYVTNKGDVRGVTTNDGRYPQFLFFAAKDKLGKNYDLYVAVKQDSQAAWSSPTPVGGGEVNTAKDEAYPWITNGGKSLYFSRKTKEGWKLMVSTRTNATGPQGWTEAKEVGLPVGFHHAAVMPDGKTMYLEGPVDKGRIGLFVSKRTAKGWGKPEELALNDADAKVGDRSPSLSRNGYYLYFASDRAGGKGGLDLYWIATKDAKAK